MMNIMLCGCLGRMGRAVTAAVTEDTVVAGVDAACGEAPYPVYAHPAECTQPVDVIIDFSNPAALAEELAYAVSHKIPAVICTTGLSQEQKADLGRAAEHIPVFFSGNMSLGVSVLAALTKKAAAILGDGFDVEIIEMHHNQKLDAPSGTALMLADAARQGLSYEPVYTYDRHAVRQKRDPHEIGISAVRGGTIVGEHQVIFAGKDEVINLTHRAQSREIFAVGALRAARFLVEQPAGMYSMEDLVNQV
ncbi:MAG: 4-hydroxy-tetrahydrodipicolinate reductase [Ruminococcaceae bacterium]|nr:4-hydroxy-tetrahydrodipicolinate reductase [Oscillospiraceae bacterium]